MNVHIKRYGQGMPLVFFHGWGFDHQIWLSLIPELQNHYELVLVDLPGFGRTDMMDWPTFKRFLLEFLPREFAIAGWSMGGLYATRLAIEEPKRVLYLLNINSSPRFVAEESWPGVTKEVFSHFYKNLSLDISKTLNEFIALQVNKSNIQFSLGAPPSRDGLESGLSILDEWDLREEIRDLLQPTCYMFGRLDPITPVKTMHKMQLDYPDFKYVLFNKAAHMPFLSHSELFIKEILEFIK
ncbi:alpha/beta fold hydrolase [Legionella fallonii]|uniref:Pimeloyl-[acyl-carrier protein] methyl ester esterase n=1 Tax=Legionella fallonii LLAP-10 TaxID=1212491 RepID=A0A098G4E3_9GAMM|nr:alpha/beta fold hydrolase [Legionella fallonii]CEG56841.1 Pimeloyl-[acyl-carrier protein] methyl ester esterase [Legionella fallonii LLAP-10]